MGRSYVRVRATRTDPSRRTKPSLHGIAEIGCGPAADDEVGKPRWHGGEQNPSVLSSELTNPPERGVVRHLVLPQHPPPLVGRERRGSMRNTLEKTRSALPADHPSTGVPARPCATCTGRTSRCPLNSAASRGSVGVGEAGFEPAISCPPDTRPNQTRPLPEVAATYFAWNFARPFACPPIPLT